MNDNKKEEHSCMVYDKEHYVVMANEIIRGKQDMSLQEAKVIRLLITQVVKEDADLKTYTCSIQELAKFLGVSPDNIYRDIRGICDDLMQRVVRVGTNNPKEPWEIFSWLQLARYDGNGNVTLMLSNQIAPYVIQLNEKFTQYQFANILNISSFYAIRFYELVKSEEYKGADYLEYTIEFLRHFFECENKYARFNDFKKRVLDVSMREINEKTDLKIMDMEYLKKGRSFDRVRVYLAFPKYYKYRRSAKKLQK